MAYPQDCTNKKTEQMEKKEQILQTLTVDSCHSLCIPHLIQSKLKRWRPSHRPPRAASWPPRPPPSSQPP